MIKGKARYGRRKFDYLAERKPRGFSVIRVKTTGKFQTLGGRGGKE